MTPLQAVAITALVAIGGTLIYYVGYRVGYFRGYWAAKREVVRDAFEAAKHG